MIFLYYSRDENFVNEIQRFIAQKADLLFTSSNEDGHRSTTAYVAEGKDEWLDSVIMLLHIQK